VQMTASCGPSAAGSLDALTFALNSPSPTRSVSPFAFTASRCAPRITQETSCPARASRTAKWLPTAPAPKMQIRMGWEVLLGGNALLVFTSSGRAQLLRRTGRVSESAALVAREPCRSVGVHPHALKLAAWREWDVRR
jgi:hypothetical protein